MGWNYDKMGGDPFWKSFLKPLEVDPCSRVNVIFAWWSGGIWPHMSKTKIEFVITHRPFDYFHLSKSDIISCIRQDYKNKIVDEWILTYLICVQTSKLTTDSNKNCFCCSYYSV